MKSSLHSIWKFRGFILENTKREFHVKHKNSLLGIFLPLLSPLAQIIIYTLVFSRVMTSKLSLHENAFSYSIFLCVGIIFWSFFAELTSRALNTFLDNANLIKKINFSKLCLPIMVTFGAGINFLIIFLIFILFLILTNNFPGIYILAIFPLILIQVLFAIGLGMCLAVINVFFRDIGQLYSVGLQFWFWLTPIVYSEDILPEKVKPFIRLNPLTDLFSAYHNVFVSHQWPEWGALIPICLLSIFLIWLSTLLYKKHFNDLIDLL
jgi:lipopolysaccharide transport system permease protein